MKKFFAILALCAMTLTLLAGCQNPEPTPTTPAPTEAPTEAQQPAENSELKAAVDYVKVMYQKMATVTASDYEVINIVNIGGTKFDVEWTANVTKGDASAISFTKGSADNLTKVDVNEKTPEEVVYSLIATVKAADGTTSTWSSDHSIPAFREFTWAEYVAAKEGDVVVVKGIVTGIMAKSKGNSYNCLYLQDGDGGYYVYNMGADPVEAGIAEGMTVRVTGSRSTYSGTYEIMNASVEILENAAVPAPVDYTAKYTAAATLKDADLTAQQSFLVTVKGVEITGQDTASGYYKFKLGNLESYVRISSSVCPIVKDDQNKLIAEHAAHLGYIANVTGILCVYDGAFYLTPVSVDAIEYVSLPERSDADKVAFEKENLTLVSVVKDAGTIDLPATGQGYENVTIAWASDNEEVAKIEDGKLIITLPKKDTVVKLTATLTAGEATDTKEFELKVQAPSDDLSTAEVMRQLFLLEPGESLNGKQVLRGTITEIVTAYSEEYKNITVNLLVTDEEHIVQAYRLSGGADLAVGDVITVTGNMKRYKDTFEFDAKCTYSKDQTVEEAKQAVVVEKLYALEPGDALTGTYALRGTITEIVTAYSEEYKNITVNLLVTDEEHIVQAYRLAGGADLAVGDTITVIGALKRYKDTFEFDAKATYSKEMTLEEARQIITVNKLYALEAGEALDGLYTLTGTITEIVTAYSEEYKNITVNLLVTDEDHIVQAYRLAGGADLAVGDRITVTGFLKRYKDTFEFDAKCTYVVAE